MKYKEFVVKLKEPIDMDSLDVSEICAVIEDVLGLAVEDVEAIFTKDKK